LAPAFKPERLRQGGSGGGAGGAYLKDLSEPGGGRMDVVVYGVEDAPEGFRVVRSVEELRGLVGRAFIVVVGDEGLAEELGVAYLTREEWGEFVRRYGKI